MSDIQLFRLSGTTAVELSGRTAAIEKHLQSLIEAQMPTFLGVRFLASEYATGKTHKGRIDSLGLDENGCPVIIEYKRHTHENVINQGLFYLDWLMDHRAEFQWLVMEKLGKDVAEQVDWSGTRLLCIAADFTRYDQHAVQQIPRNIELIRYKLFGDDLLLLDLVNSVSVDDATAIQAHGTSERARPVGKGGVAEKHVAHASSEMRTLYEALSGYLLALGDDVQEKHLKQYIAFRRLKNFVCVVPQRDRLLVMLKVDPDTVGLEEGFSRDIRHVGTWSVPSRCWIEAMPKIENHCGDVRNIGTWGAGDLELCLRTPADFERTKPLIERSYGES